MKSYESSLTSRAWKVDKNSIMIFNSTVCSNCSCITLAHLMNWQTEHLRRCRKWQDVYLHAATVGDLQVMNGIACWMRSSQLLLLKKQLWLLLFNMSYSFFSTYQSMQWVGYLSGFQCSRWISRWIHSLGSDSRRGREGPEGGVSKLIVED